MNDPHILVVEDEALIMANLVNTLTMLGYTVHEPVATGEEAIRAVITKKPDLVLMDIELVDEMNGIEAAEKIRKIADIPIVYITANTDDLRLKQAQLTGPYGYIIKPAHRSELKATIEIALYKHMLDRKLRDSEARFRTITERISDVIFILDLEGNPTYVSPSITPILGIPQDSFIKKGAGPETIHPDDLAKIEQAMEKLKNGSLAEQVEFRMKKHDGSYAVFDGRVIPVMTGGVYAGVQMVARDITEHKRVEDSLKESEAKYRIIVENTNDAIYLHNFEGKILGLNENACRMVGYEKEELIGFNLAKIDSGWRFTPNPDLDLLLSRGNHVFERLNTRKDRSVFPIEVSGKVVDRNGKGIVQAFVRDITERKQAEEALRQANKKLNLLSGITRHDINNQLAVLVGYVRDLEKKQPDPSLNEHFQKINATAQRISAMIQFTKEYDRIGVNIPQWQDCRTLVDMAAKQASVGNVLVKNDLPSHSEVFADPMVVRVCFNLIDNAIRYGEKITTIRFSLQESGDNHVVVCEDDGNGVPADYKEKIFEPGYGKNTGLGLSLAREILDITGISLRETGEPGKGARFEITVPKGAWRQSGDGERSKKKLI